MNCKPNDLAYICRPGPLFGRVVTVTSIDPQSPADAPSWLYEGTRVPVPWIAGAVYDSLRDSVLRPIAGPTVEQDKREEVAA